MKNEEKNVALNKANYSLMNILFKLTRNIFDKKKFLKMVDLSILSRHKILSIDYHKLKTIPSFQNFKKW